MFFGLPIAASALITAMFAGWTSVVVAIVFWVAIIVIGSLAARLAIGTFGPVRELIAAAGRLAEGDYTARVSKTDSPAIRPVVESFNQMAERLEISDDLRRRLLADVGHELRTPTHNHSRRDRSDGRRSAGTRRGRIEARPRRR